MTVEYRIRLVDGEWVVTQRFDPRPAGQVEVKQAGSVKELPGSYEACLSCCAGVGGGGMDEADPGGGGMDEADPGGSAAAGPPRFVLFGPLVVCGCGSAGAGPGGGGMDDADPGGSGRNARRG